jgi:hypothetical protein
VHLIADAVAWRSPIQDLGSTMKRLLGSLLAVLLPASFPAPSDAWLSDPIESTVGIHVIPNFGDDAIVSTPAISDAAIGTALRSVDWISGFHQVVVVTSPGVSMEVGGSLAPEHGLSAMFRDRHDRTDAVIVDAPETVEEMERILTIFSRGDDVWKREFEFSFKRY